jgi:hypothetical protein
MSSEVRVDPARLESAARVTESLRESLRSGLTDVEPETMQAARDLAGWRTGRSVEDLAWWWRDDLAKLDRRLDALADGLSWCARDYRYTDHASAENFRAVR